MYTFIYLTLFTFKLEPTEVQDAAKKPNFYFNSYPTNRTIQVSLLIGTFSAPV